MLSKECEKCLDEIQDKSRKIHGKIQDDATILFDKLETKQNALLDTFEKRLNYLMLITLFLLGIFGTVIGYTYVKQEKIVDELDNKINRSDALTITEAQLLREQGDRVYDIKYVLKDTIKGDTMTYYSNKQLIWRSILRSENNQRR